MFASYKLGKYLAMVFAIGMVMALPQFISAQGATISFSDVYTLTDPPVKIEGGGAKLVRTDNGVSMKLMTDQLEPGAYTVWFLVFNNPDGCSLGSGMCGETDEDFAVGGPAGFGFTFATGHIVGESGKANFAGSLMVGEPLLNGDAVLDGTILESSRTTEIHLVVRYHSAAVPGRIPEQIHTSEGFEDPNVFDVQFAQFAVVP